MEVKKTSERYRPFGCLVIILFLILNIGPVQISLLLLFG